MCRILRLPDPPTIRNINGWHAESCPIIDITDSPNCVWVPFWKWDKREQKPLAQYDIPDWPVL